MILVLALSSLAVAACFLGYIWGRRDGFQEGFEEGLKRGRL